MNPTTFELLPIEFWLAAFALAFVGVFAFTQIRRGIGLPLLAVIGTVVVWYVGDVIYNDYSNNHHLTFPPEVLSAAWLQVVIFTIVLLAGTLVFHQLINHDCLHNPSRVFEMYKRGDGGLEIQNTLNLFAKICVAIWCGLIVLAFFNVGSKAISFALPFLGRPVDAFTRGRVGSGPLSAVFALATNFHVLVAAGFGLVAALSRDPRIRLIALVGCLMTWPYFLLNRTRNTMLAACVPGIIAWIFIRIRQPLTVKLILLGVAIFVGDTWLRFVMEARNNQSSVAQYFFSLEAEDIVENKTKHGGLNMYEELCWLNLFIDNGHYSPNMGKRYFAELVNPIPRAIWNGKPLIGIDYAIARGQEWEFAGQAQAGVAATISTGMVGQGVSNFGPWVGPVAAGMLMALWVVLLTRIDLHAESSWRLPLYAIGLVLTFNCGRDITFLVLYPFVFGFVIVKYLEMQQRKNAVNIARAASYSSGW